MGVNKTDYKRLWRNDQEAKTKALNNVFVLKKVIELQKNRIEELEKQLEKKNVKKRITTN